MFHRTRVLIIKDGLSFVKGFGTVFLVSPCPEAQGDSGGIITVLDWVVADFLLWLNLHLPAWLIARYVHEMRMSIGITYQHINMSLYSLNRLTKTYEIKAKDRTLRVQVPFLNRQVAGLSRDPGSQPFLDLRFYTGPTRIVPLFRLTNPQ